MLDMKKDTLIGRAHDLIAEKAFIFFLLNDKIVKLKVHILDCYFSCVLCLFFSCREREKKKGQWNFCGKRVNKLKYESNEIFNKKMFYSRSTNSAAFCALVWMSLPTPFPSMQLK